MQVGWWRRHCTTNVTASRRVPATTCTDFDRSLCCAGFCEDWESVRCWQRSRCGASQWQKPPDVNSWKCETSRLLVHRTAIVDARLRLLTGERWLTFAVMHWTLNKHCWQRTLLAMKSPRRLVSANACDSVSRDSLRREGIRRKCVPGLNAEFCRWCRCLSIWIVYMSVYVWTFM